MKVNDRVTVTENTEDGLDLKWMGWSGTIKSIDDGYAEVELDEQGTDTFSFGLYQLTLIPEIPENLEMTCHVLGTAHLLFRVYGMTDKEVWDGIKNEEIHFDFDTRCVTKNKNEIGSIEISSDFDLDYFESKFGNHRHDEETNDLME